MHGIMLGTSEQNRHGQMFCTVWWTISRWDGETVREVYVGAFTIYTMRWVSMILDWCTQQYLRTIYVGRRGWRAPIGGGSDSDKLFRQVHHRWSRPACLASALNCLSLCNDCSHGGPKGSSMQRKYCLGPTLTRPSRNHPNRSRAQPRAAP